MYAGSTAEPLPGVRFLAHHVVALGAKAHRQDVVGVGDLPLDVEHVHLAADGAGRSDRVFNAYVNIGSLAGNVKQVRDRYPSAKFIPHAAISETSSNCWNLRVISVFI